MRLNYRVAAMVMATVVFSAPILSMGNGVNGWREQRQQQRFDAIDPTIGEAVVVGAGQSEFRIGALKYLFDIRSVFVFIESGSRHAFVDMDMFDNHDFVKPGKVGPRVPKSPAALTLPQYLCG